MLLFFFPPFAQFFEDFSYLDMDQWDLSSVPMGLN